MKKTAIIILSLLFGMSAFATHDTLEYQFDKARALLAQRQVKEAIDELRVVYIDRPENANINFLMGAAYTELSGNQEQAAYHLKLAAQNVNENYKVGSFKEEGAPIHVYYYLAILLVEMDQCAQANQAFLEFSKFSGKVDKYFIEEVDRHLQKCPFSEDEDVKNWKTTVELPKDYDPTYVKRKETIALDTAEMADRGLVTQKLEYTTNAPLYGVQIGSNLNPSPTSSYSKVKNVDVFIDNEGIIRYVVGHFSYRKQAESLLETLKEKGFVDAFVVNVNNERKYSNEVISYQNINLRAGLRGDIEYYVQLGAFNDTVPKSLLELYYEIDGIQEIKKGEKTVLMVGSFKKYQEALNRKDKVDAQGIKDSFVVAYNRGKRIPLDEAINYTD